MNKPRNDEIALAWDWAVFDTTNYVDNHPDQAKGVAETLLSMIESIADDPTLADLAIQLTQRYYEAEQ
jgi:ABC-type nitrate/sulfonate/bicarbonate transport system substrate-binding protein